MDKMTRKGFLTTIASAFAALALPPEKPYGETTDVRIWPYALTSAAVNADFDAQMRPFKDGEWHRVCRVADGARERTYVDGKLHTFKALRFDGKLDTVYINGTA